MKITRDNYESFFIDYLEGNLPENQIDQFLDFLNQNPDLKEELHLFEEIRLPREPLVFQEKKQLYKKDADETHRLENMAVAYMEGDLEETERKTFEIYLTSHPELEKQYNRLTKTRLVADPGIKYLHKQKLYRNPGTVIALNWLTRAAAVVVLLWGINSVIQTQNAPESPKTNTELAELSTKPNPTSSVKLAGSEKPYPEIIIPDKSKDNRPQTTKKFKETQAVISEPIARDLAALSTISPIAAQIEYPSETQLAFSKSVNVMKINEPNNSISIEEFLAMRAKKVGKEGLFSAQRIARLGLNLASVISGERIGYGMKDGKISSVGFESKLMAFSIPLEKK